MQGMPMQGMPMQGQPMMGQSMQGMPMQGQPMQGQPMMGQPMQGQPMQGMPMQGMQMMMPGPNDSTATKGYKMAMIMQMQNMPKQYTGDADVDFMAQMRAHHQSAIDMAQVVLAEGKDAQVKKLAQDIIAAQKKETAEIDGWMAKKK